jgi:hypothetical protein
VRIRVPYQSIIDDLFRSVKLCEEDQQGKLSYLSSEDMVTKESCRKRPADENGRWMSGMQKPLKVAKSVHTALVLQLPEGSEAYERVEKMRRKHDPAMDEWEPHIKLACPFLPASAFQLCKVQREFLEAGIVAFDVCLDELSAVDCKCCSQSVFFLDADKDSAKRLKTLHEHLLRAFPVHPSGPWVVKEEAHDEGCRISRRRKRCRSVSPATESDVIQDSASKGMGSADGTSSQEVTFLPRLLVARCQHYQGVKGKGKRSLSDVSMPCGGAIDANAVPLGGANTKSDKGCSEVDANAVPLGGANTKSDDGGSGINASTAPSCGEDIDSDEGVSEMHATPTGVASGGATPTASEMEDSGYGLCDISPEDWAARKREQEKMMAEFEEMERARQKNLEEFKHARRQELLGAGPIRFRVEKVSLCERPGLAQPFEEVASIRLSRAIPT